MGILDRVRDFTSSTFEGGNKRVKEEIAEYPEQYKIYLEKHLKQEYEWLIGRYRDLEITLLKETPGEGDKNIRFVRYDIIGENEVVTVEEHLKFEYNEIKRDYRYKSIGKPARIQLTGTWIEFFEPSKDEVVIEDENPVGVVSTYIDKYRRRYWDTEDKNNKGIDTYLEKERIDKDYVRRFKRMYVMFENKKVRFKTIKIGKHNVFEVNLGQGITLYATPKHIYHKQSSTLVFSDEQSTTQEMQEQVMNLVSEVGMKSETSTKTLVGNAIEFYEAFGIAVDLRKKVDTNLKKNK